MKHSGFKGALCALATVGIAFAAKKAYDRRKFIKGIFEEYGIKEKTPFGLADKIRELDDKDYAELKDKFKAEFASKCCCKSHCKTDVAEA